MSYITLHPPSSFKAQKKYLYLEGIDKISNFLTHYYSLECLNIILTLLSLSTFLINKL